MDRRILESVRILDGDFRTQLKRHLTKRELQHPRYELQVLATNRNAVYKTHLDFLRAGSCIIRTNTHRASITSLAEYMQIGPTDSMHIFNVAVQLAKKAVCKYYREVNGDTGTYESFISLRAKIAGTCGSFAAANFDEVYDYPEQCPSYWDIMPANVLMRWHRNRVQALLTAGVDMLAFESIPCAREAEALVALLREFPHARAWITFFCPNGNTLLDGRDFHQVAAQCYQSLPGQIIAIGVCCKSATSTTAAITRLNDHLGPEHNVPLIACPQKWIGYYGYSKFECDLIPGHMLEWLSIGVRYIGGNGAVNADDILDIRETMQNFTSNSTITVRPNASSLRNEKNKSKI